MKPGHSVTGTDTMGRTPMAKANTLRGMTRGMSRLAHDQAILRQVVVVCGVIAIVASFDQVRWTYVQIVGMWWPFAVLVPLLVDGLAVFFAAIAGTVANRPFKDRAYAWSCLGFFVGVSIFCNWLHAYHFSSGRTLPEALEPYRWAVILLLSAIPPVGAAIGMHGRSFIDRAGIDADLPEQATRVHAQRTPPARTPAPAPRATPRTVINELARTVPARPAAPAAQAVEDARASQPAPTRAAQVDP